MDITELEIQNSCQLDLSSFAEEDRLIWDTLPQDYRDFLANHNGGFVNSDKTNFVIKFQRVYQGKVYDTATNSVDEFWCFLSYENSQPVEGEPVSILHEHFDRHVEEDFLPEGIYVIGRCIQNSLICISVNKADYGAIYYWEWYWQYPWYKDFFDRRVEAVSIAYPDSKVILDDESNPQYQEVVDAFNYATIIKVSDTFDGFIASFFEEAE